ncbi:MAG: ATP-binding protein [Desulfuromonadales bacterium]
MFFKSLITRVIIINIILLSIGFGAFTLFHIRREQFHLIATTKESAALLLQTIERSIFNAMRLGNTHDVQATLEMVGRGSRLRSVRIFHPDGTVLKSSHPKEIGTKVNAQDMALYLGRRSEGTYRVDGEEVLGIVKPIVSDSRCYPCHGMGRKVVGVLNLNFSLAHTSQQLRESSKLFMGSTMVIVILLAASISFILIRFVKRPMHLMADKMSQVEDGDLSVRLTPQYPDEIGSLMNSFNAMVSNLDKTKKELESYHYRQMERADRLASVGEMATGLAHEIKNPLAGISGAISVLAAEFPDDDERRQVVDEVLEQIKRLDKTVTDLLYFGRPGTPELAFADINDLADKTLFLISQHPEARNVHRVKELTRDLPLACVDPKQVQQVFLNIFINAIQAMKEGGTLSVGTDRYQLGEREMIRIRIADSGDGIPQEKLEKIFTPFFTTKTQGTGLGLAICKRLVEEQGGGIQVESRQGEGTTFAIDLPAASENSLIPISEEDRREQT